MKTSYKKFALFFVLTSVTSLSFAEDESNERQLVSELASAVHQYLLSTYTCREYLGIEMYRAAKLTSESIFVRMGADLNQAVLLVQKKEDQLKVDMPEKAMEAVIKEQGISESDALSGCQRTVSDDMDKLKLLQAKLGLL